MMRKAEEERKVTEDWVRDGVKKKRKKRKRGNNDSMMTDYGG